jgi:toxin YoeB
VRHALAGYWSRRIDDEHRIIYKPAADSLLIAQLRHHT